MAKEFSFNFKRGDTKRIRFGITDKDGNSLNLGVTDEIYFTLKTSENSTEIILQKKLSSNQLTYSNGELLVRLTHTDTNTLTPAIYKYDIQVCLDNNSLVETVWEGDLELEKDVTRN